MREILSALDAQQREELSALKGRVEETRLKRARNARKKLSSVAMFFIEGSWEIIAPQLEGFSLEVESGKSTAELQEYLEMLRERQPAYAWGWIRARMDARLMAWIEAAIPDLLAQHPEKARLYTNCLRNVDRYWFRETPLQHLKAGYHTALGAACKWYGSAFELLHDSPQSCPHVTRHFPEELRRFASFSLTMLTRTDRYLWDSSAAEPLEAVIEDGEIKVAPRALQRLSLDSAPDYGLRLGCPALRARRQAGLPAFPGIIAWVEQIFTRSLLHRAS